MEITIRQFRLSDAPGFHAAVLESVDHISPWLSWCDSSYSLEKAKAWTSSAKHVWEAGTDYRFIIEDRNTQSILGTVGINQVVQQHKVGNLGYWVRKSALNRGICTRAARLVIHYAFAKLDFQRIEIHVHPDNQASNLVAQKIGAVFEGVFRNKLLFNGKPISAKCYSVIPLDYGL